MAKLHAVHLDSILALRQRRDRLLAQSSVAPQAIRASVVERFGTCGKPGSACHSGAKHGP